jgi:AcrR family transcriptional regulator
MAKRPRVPSPSTAPLPPLRLPNAEPAAPSPQTRPKRRPGRPRASDGAETRATILVAARSCFARFGYEKTTNKHIAEQAGISAGTLYHYFESKPALFAEVGREVGNIVMSRLHDALKECTDLNERLPALIRAFSQITAQDRTIAVLISLWATEVHRHEELAALVGPDPLGDAVHYYEGLGTIASARDELAKGIEPVMVGGVITSVLFGLSMLAQVMQKPALQQAASEGFARLFEGTFFKA